MKDFNESDPIGLGGAPGSTKPKLRLPYLRYGRLSSPAKAGDCNAAAFTPFG